MAKANKEYGRRVVKGFEVFEVGQKQFMSFGSWNPFNGGVTIYKKAKGLWIVMACGTTFGGKRYGSRVRVVEECKTLKEAVYSCQVCTDILSYTAGKAHTRYDGKVRHTPSIAYDYEIWHIVDDGELWQAWDVEAAAAGGDLQAAQQWEATFHDDTYLRQIWARED